MNRIFVIIGSAGGNSANERLVYFLEDLVKNDLAFSIFNGLRSLPHFDASLAIDNPPDSVIELRNSIENADGVLICTPEYIFSVPSGLKNALEWCVATTVFSNKPTGLITASASGEKGHEELQLIMKTLMAEFSQETTLLISGIKGKINQQAIITDNDTSDRLRAFINAFALLVKSSASGSPE